MSNPLFIGRTEFENEDGQLMFVCDWELPKALRPLEVVAPGGIYQAQRQTGNGDWVYRRVRDKNDLDPMDPYLKNFKDEPRPEKVKPTLKDVRLMLLGLIKDGNKSKGMVKTTPLVEIAELLRDLEK